MRLKMPQRWSIRIRARCIGFVRDIAYSKMHVPNRSRLWVMQGVMPTSPFLSRLTNLFQIQSYTGMTIAK